MAACATSTPQAAYLIAVKQFLAWAESRGLELPGVAPRTLARLWETASYASGHQHRHRKPVRPRFRHFFDGLVNRHAILLNPAVSVRSRRYQVVEGETPESPFRTSASCWPPSTPEP